jgi:hypothetical protein
MVTTKTGQRLAVPIKNTWTRICVCLYKITANEVPAASEKIRLSWAGLGVKKVVFDKEGKACHIYEKLVEEVPPLGEGGGFEILRTTEQSSKILKLVPAPPGGYTVPYLKSVLGQARGFIRPLQEDLKAQNQTSVFQVLYKLR